ncbi:MAG: sigma-54-dependent Fis family transcriptional regulator [Deltaproteobacteria bacterium]|nr:sigma-54-dependent Fis family transcriptional regulator [Deltaproteobacteria bacterium]
MTTNALEILVVEDEDAQRELICDRLRAEGYRVRDAADADSAIAQFGARPPDLVLMDIRLPGMDGFEAAKTLRSMPANRYVPIIACTARDQIEDRAQAFDFGIDDYVTKPFEMAQLVLRIRSAARMIATFTDYRRAVTENQRLRSMVEEIARQVPRPRSSEHIVGDSDALHGVFARLMPAAVSDATVLLLGETGTGKELFARLIHDNSPRRDRAFVVQDCTTLPGNLVESELFGHTRGAFTGATGARAGLIVSADGGTVFLDEIGDLPSDAQARLLRLVQEREIRPVGSDTVHKVDVRLIAATHCDLEQRVRDGRFRADLFYRLGQLRVTIPPLRERVEDIPLLVAHFLAEYARRYGKRMVDASAGAIDTLRAYPFPGNVRQLRHEIERAVIFFGDEPALEIVHLSEEIRRETRREAGGSAPMAASREREASLVERRHEAERGIVEDALRASGYSITRTATALGLTRQGLRKKLIRLGFSSSKTPES